MKTLSEIASAARNPISYTVCGNDDKRGRTNCRQIARRMKKLGARVKIDQRKDSEGKVMHNLTSWELFAQ